MEGSVRNPRLCFPLVVVTLLYSLESSANDFKADWSNTRDRIWVGPDFWANRLQDWRVAHERLECIEGNNDRPMRTVHLLTHRLGAQDGDFELSVQLGQINDAGPHDAMTGFLIGAGQELDYRGAALVHHSPGPGGGIFAGCTGNGLLLFRDFEDSSKQILATGKDTALGLKNITLKLVAKSSGNRYTLELSAHQNDNGKKVAEVKLSNVSPEKLVGNIALVSHPGSADKGARFWFNHWTVTGSKILVDKSRTCGPVLSTQYTLTRRILKLTAQMMPLGDSEPDVVYLQIKRDVEWETVAQAEIVEPGWTATFRVEDWDDSRNIAYRVLYFLRGKDKTEQQYSWPGTIRRDPKEQEEIVLTGFTGNHNVKGSVERGYFEWNKAGVWFPHADILRSVRTHQPDLLFFSGDQVYESASPTSADRSGDYSSFLDYMYKWYLWCWAFRDLTRDIVTVTMPDDHDVYQGNLWGHGGRRTKKDDEGGYVMPANFVRMVERTQTSHLPDPFDPTPIDQNIGVYYTDLNYGRISFAIIEDRKFKSGCAGLVPSTTSGRADHVISPNFDPATADVPEATLLGERQLEFLRQWAQDWRGADMKASLSQTVFAGVATHHGPDMMRLIVDYDSNGWPQTGRNRALAELRRGFAFMIGGDQHLATVVHHGINDWNDAGWSFTVPSIANFYPRAWLPQEPGKNRQKLLPAFTGEHTDGLGNKITVLAATNPRPMGQEPEALHDKMPGYGVVRFNKENRTITMECWPRFADPNNPEEAQYQGWPITVSQVDNYKGKVTYYLPTFEVEGVMNPVCQIIRESTNEIIYTIRIGGKSFRPHIFSDGKYTVILSDPEHKLRKVIRNVQPVSREQERTIVVKFQRP